MGKYVFGIDLGTTYSCIAYVDDTGRPTVIPNKEGDATTPSVVNFASSDSVVVGQIAKEVAEIDPQNTISLVKTLMGKSKFAINYNGEDWSPEQVSAEILKKLTRDAAEALNTEVRDVVITCPAYFGTTEAEATRVAGEIAGLNVIEIMREPTAAALYYGVTKATEEKTFLVYDLGGGTFDVTVMKVSVDGNIEVVCMDGDHDLGGKDWDVQLMNYLAAQFCEATGFDGDFDEYGQQTLRLKAETAKKQLTQRPEVPVMLDAEGLRARINVTQDIFDEITESLLEQTIEKTDAVLNVAKSKNCEIDEIFMVGGSTKMPQVSRILQERYGVPISVLDPDQAVAKGAALYAVVAYSNQKSNQEEEPESELVVRPEHIPTIGGGTIKDIKIEMAATKSYGLDVFRNGNELLCNNIIIKNAKMTNGEVTVTKEYGTHVDNQTEVEFNIYESDFMDEWYEIDDDYLIGTATLPLPGNLPADSPLQVTFSLNTEGILKLRGVDLVTKKEVNAEFVATNGISMTKEEIKKAKEKSKGIVVE